jgi:6-phosphogluconolactonase (cycloisomerase 2 family)
MAGCGGTDSQPPDAPPADTTPPVDAALPDADATPVLSAITPTTGIVTTSITLTGSRFGASQGSSTVTVGGVTAAVTSWSDTAIVATVPDVLPGPAAVHVVRGSAQSAAQQFQVVLPAMAYLHNDANDTNGSDTITVMSFDRSTGAMAQVGTPIAMGTATSSYGGCSQSIVVHERTRRVFAAGATGVAVYAIDPVTGALTAVAGSPFATNGMRAFGLTLNAAGTRLFVTSYDSKQVAVFDVAASGVLAHVPSSPFLTTNGVDTIAITGNDAYIYANSYNNSFQGFSVGATGALTSLGTPYTPGGTAIWARPGHDQLYVTIGSGTLAVFNIDTTTGVPTQMTGSPFAINRPSGMLDSPTFNSDGSRLYMGNDNSGYIVAYTIAVDGTPTAIAGSPFNFTASLSDISCLALSRDGTRLLAAGENQPLVGVFSIDAAGVPAPVTNSPFMHTTPQASVSGLAITF